MDRVGNSVEASLIMKPKSIKKFGQLDIDIRLSLGLKKA